MNRPRFSGISGSTLKIIAILSMLVDHIGAVLFENGLMLSSLASSGQNAQLFSGIDRILRLIGRPAFPIFCFLLVEGFLHTSNVKKYALRLLVFAAISELPFDLAIHNALFSARSQNVFFTLLIGLLVMILVSRLSGHILLQCLIYAAGLLAGYLLRTDYGFKGVLLIELLYLFRYDRISQCVAGAISFCWEYTAPLAFLPIYVYNGKRGISLKYFFYWFYPVHLLLLAAISHFYLCRL